MSWREFFASVIDALAWPLLVGAVVYVFREPLRDRIRYLRRARLPGNTELEFGERVGEAEVTFHSVVVQQGMTVEPKEAEEKALITELGPQIAEAPRAAVIEAWLAVERELEALAQESGIDLAERTWTAPALADELVKRGLIEASALAAVIAELRDARNVAAHARPYTVDRDEVVDYVKLAGRVRSVLRLARQRNAAAQEGRTSYDLLVYYDTSDSTTTTGGTIPRVGDRAEEWFGEKIGKDRHVVAVGPGIHKGRVAVVLAHGSRPMAELQAMLDQLGLAERGDDAET
jgi:hypothetical protein